VLLIGPAVLAGVAHSAWLATIRAGEASGVQGSIGCHIWG